MAVGWGDGKEKIRGRKTAEQGMEARVGKMLTVSTGVHCILWITGLVAYERWKEGGYCFVVSGHVRGDHSRLAVGLAQASGIVVG